MTTHNNCLQIRWPAILPECDGPCRDPDQYPKEVPHWQKNMYLDGVERTAASGCPKCMLIYRCCREFEPKGGSLRIWSSSNDTGILSLDAKHRVDMITHERTIKVQMYIQLGEPKTDWRFIKPGRFPMTSRREEHGSRLATWISECETAHSGCTTSQTRLPLRVIDVGIKNQSQLFLHVSSGETGRYVALSHCWGPEHLHPPKTNLSDLEEHLEAERVIGFNSLPRTFQDAIVVTWGLGIRYLWIDSLCIVQDDKLDWQRESSKMADYYSNAYLVISASQAGDSTQGFLDATESATLLDPDSATQIGQITNADSSISRIYRRVLNQASWKRRHQELLRKSPLSRRAWSLQENMLAKRIVHFTKGELLWECTQGLKCECLETDHAITSRNGAEGMTRKLHFMSLRYDKAEPDLHGLWLGMLQQYSYMKLSYASDVLPALSGLAKLWISRGADRYLSGFWEKDILESISWYALEWGERHAAGVYRAPSWSPFSVEVKDKESNRWRHIHFRFQISTSRLMKKSAVVLDAGVTLAGADPTGEISSAYLLLGGRIIRGKVSPERDIQIEGDTSRPNWDTEVDRHEGLPLILLLLGFNGKGGTMALVLKDSEQKGAYERVALLNQVDRANSSVLIEQFGQSDIEKIKIV